MITHKGFFFCVFVLRMMLFAVQWTDGIFHLLSIKHLAALLVYAALRKFLLGSLLSVGWTELTFVLMNNNFRLPSVPRLTSAPDGGLCAYKDGSKTDLWLTPAIDPPVGGAPGRINATLDHEM